MRRGRRQGRSGCHRVRCLSSSRAMCVVNVATIAISKVTSDNKQSHQVTGVSGQVSTPGTHLCWHWCETSARLSRRLLRLSSSGLAFPSAVQPRTRRTFGIAGPHPNTPALLQIGPVYRCGGGCHCEMWRVDIVLETSRSPGDGGTAGTCCWLFNDMLMRLIWLTTVKCRCWRGVDTCSCVGDS